MSAGPVQLARLYDDGWRIALLGAPGRKWTQALVMESSGLSLRKVPNTEANTAQPLHDYPIRRAVRHFRNAGRSFGMTQAARDFLRQAEACGNPKEHQL